MSLDVKDAIRTEKTKRKDGHIRTTYVFKCQRCSKLMRVRQDALNSRNGLCISCVHQKRPFESIYNGLFNDHRKLPVDLSYEEFVEFTKINECHYCGDAIPWNLYSIANGRFVSRAYFLDRKDLNAGYSKENCVVCCTRCNRIRCNFFTYQEFTLLVPILRQIRLSRLTNGVCGL
jgi:hypothetical protein